MTEGNGGSSVPTETDTLVTRRRYIKRPEWLTDAECDEIARRTHMAMCEAGAMDGEMLKNPNPKIAYQFESTDDAMFERARLLSLMSMGLTINDDDEVVRG